MRRLRRLLVVVRRLQMGLLKLLISSPSGKSVFATAGSLAMFAAIRRASSSVSTFAMSAASLVSREYT